MGTHPVGVQGWRHCRRPSGVKVNQHLIPFAHACEGADLPHSRSPAGVGSDISCHVSCATLFCPGYVCRDEQKEEEQYWVLAYVNTYEGWAYGTLCFPLSAGE